MLLAQANYVIPPLRPHIYNHTKNQRPFTSKQYLETMADHHLTLKFTIDGSLFIADNTNDIVTPPDPENYQALVVEIARLMTVPIVAGTTVTVTVPLNKTGRLSTLLDYVQVFKELSPGQVYFKGNYDHAKEVREEGFKYLEYLVEDLAVEAGREVEDGEGAAEAQQKVQEGEEKGGQPVDLI